MPKPQPLSTPTMSKGGHNPPNTSTARPPDPKGSGGAVSLPEPAGFPKDFEWPTPPEGLDFRVEGAPPEWLLRLAERLGWCKREKRGMNAEEARQIAEQAKKPIDIGHWVTAIDGKIRAAASKGERSIRNPFHGYRTPLPNPETWKAVREHYEAAGFTWREVPPPTEYPPSKGFTEITW